MTTLGSFFNINYDNINTLNFCSDLASIVGSRLTKFFPDVPSLTKIVDHCRKASKNARTKEAGEHAYRLLTHL